MILRKPIGEILVEMGHVTGDQLAMALEQQRRLVGETALPEGIERVRLISEARMAEARGKIPRLGEIFLDLSLIDSSDLRLALEEQARSIGVYGALDRAKLGVTIETCAIVNSSLNISEVLGHIMAHVNEVTQSVASTLMLLDETTGELVFSVPTGPKADTLTDIRLSPGKGIAGWVAEHRKPALIQDVKTDQRFFPGIDLISGLATESILCVPLMAKNRLIGVLEVINKADGSAFSEEDLHLLRIFGHQAAMAIENARYYNELKIRFDELRRAETALRRSENRYRQLADSLAEGLAVQDENGRITYVNDRCCQMLGYQRAEVIGRRAAEFVHEESLPVFYEQMAGRRQGRESRYEITLSGKGGRTISALMAPRAMFDADGRFKGSFSAVVDITQRKKEEAAFQEAEKMKAIETLAGGIAHQFNNALTGISGNIELLKMSFPNEKDVDRYTRSMASCLGKMSGLTRQLLAYALGGRYQPRVFPLTAFVRDTLALVKPRIDQNIRIETDLPAASLHVDADPAQMQMVLSAIMTNAAEALDGRGRIRVSLMAMRVESGGAGGHLVPDPGDYACLAIEDNGKGMDPETRKRIFEPFFTTNFQGRGLGLAAAYGVVRNHNGWITVDSELRKGSVVKIYLPAVPPPPDRDAA